MKKILSLFLFLFAIIVSFGKPIEIKGEAEYETKSYKLFNVADATIRGGVNKDKNFGKFSQLNINHRLDYGDIFSEAYVKFTIPANAKNITKADLILTYQNVPDNLLSRSITILTVSSDWEEGVGKADGSEAEVVENRITFNNVPSSEPENNSLSYQFSGSLPVRYDTVSIDVKDLVNNYLEQYSIKDAPTNISFRLFSNATKNEIDLNFCSKEHTNENANGPMLDLTLDVEKKVIEPTILYDGLSLTSERITNKSGKDSSIYALEIDSSSSLTVVTGVPNNVTPLQPGMRQTPSQMAEAYQNDGYNVLAAINGDFFKMNDENTENLIQPRGLTIKDGELLTPLVDWTFFGIKNDGTPVIGDPTTFDSLKNELKHAVGGDSGYLVKNGVAITNNSDGGCHSQDTAAPRTAIGIKEDNSIVMVVVDGRTTESQGLVLTDLAQYMLDKGCVNAINLDGGGSSTMSIKNFEDDTFAPINKPSDADGERPVGNGLLVIDPTNSILNTNLKNKINEATDLVNNSQYGNEIGKYPEEQKAYLNIAIVNAKAVLVDENKTQKTIDDAVIVLQEAIDNFKASIITKVFDNLNVLINEANNLLLHSIFGTDIGNYPTEQKDLLSNALLSANEIVDNTETTQEIIDSEIIKLQKAIDEFKSSIIVLKDEILLNKINEATQLFNNSTYGDNINEYPYSAGILLNNSINNAINLLAKENVKQSEVDQEVIILTQAIQNFTNSKILLNTNELKELIEKVEYKLEDITFGDQTGNYNEEQKNIIEHALNYAIAVINNPESTQEDIDNALNDLNQKVENLNNSVITTNDNNELIFLFVGLGGGVLLSLSALFIRNKLKKLILKH